MKIGNKTFTVRDLTACAMLVALNVVMAEVCKVVIIPKVLELSFGFLPLALAGMLLGPVPAMAVGAMGDIIGALIFYPGDFFPGYTLTAVVTGLIYGLFLRKKNGWQCVLICQALVSLICFAGLNTLWAALMGYGANTAYVTTRLIVNAVAYPIYMGIIYLMTRYRKTLEGALHG